MQLYRSLLICLLLCYPLSANSQDFEDPVAYIGHGVLFDSNGHPIDATENQLTELQKMYLDALQQRASSATRDEDARAFDQLEGALRQVDAPSPEARRYFESRAQLALIERLASREANPAVNLGHARLVAWLIRTETFPEGDHPELPERLEAAINDLSRTAPPVEGGALRFSTYSEGEAYRLECEANGVPIPPGWGEPGWVPSPDGVLADNEEFISARAEARPHLYTAPEGVCIALPRVSGSTISLLGIICQGTQSSKVCFWDNQENDLGFNIPVGDSVPLSDFAGGAELYEGSGGVCTDCHSGENPYVIHPGTALGYTGHMPDDWYDPMVHPLWPQNAGPSLVVPTIPGANNCISCHTAGNAGRFPHMSQTNSPGYCNTVFASAIGDPPPRRPNPPPVPVLPDPTMPTFSPGSDVASAHVAAMRALCLNAAEPILRIEEEVLSFGQVELGFAFRKALVLHNDGDANLTVEVNRTTPNGDPNLTHFTEITELGSTVIAPGDPPIVLAQTYEPSALGAHQIQLQVVTNDASAPATNILLTGEGTQPRPIDTVLVLDRSGSMSDPAGDRSKIEAMRDSVMLYTDLMRETVGDRLGFVRYNQSNDVYFPLTSITAGVQNAIGANELSSAALVDLARLQPDGRTGIGGAMMTAADEVGGPDPSRGSVVVVLTDGKENESPNIASAISDIGTNHSHVQMYSIGLGFDIEPTKLQNITNMGDDGYHQVTNTMLDSTLFDLEAFYFKIFASAANMDLVTDPTHIVNLASGKPVVVDRATVISSDRSATFIILDDPSMRGFYDLSFIAPDGQVLSPGVNIGGIPIQEQVRGSHRIYRIVFPDPSQAGSYAGDWVLVLTPNGRWTDDAAKNAQAESQHGYGGQMQPVQGQVPIGFAGAVSSNYRMAASITATNYLPGATLKLDATLTDRGWPAPDGNVHVRITRPDGVTHTVTLRDDGTSNDGAAGDATWANVYTQTAPSGVYRLLFRSIGRNERGELAPRLVERYVTLAQPEPPYDPGKPGGGDPSDTSGGNGTPCGNCENSAAAYLIGSFDLRKGGQAMVDVLNPTERPLEFVISLFTEHGKAVQCVRDKIAGNGIRNVDIERLDPRVPLGVIKIVAFEPGTTDPAMGLVANQRHRSDQGIETTGLHPISRDILKKDIKRILELCR